jgi:predicted DNA-binding transcriptional regulator AlpA
MQETEQLLDVTDVAKMLKLYRRDKVTLNIKRVYELPIRKTKIGGSVRYRESDVRLYINMQAA